MALRKYCQILSRKHWWGSPSPKSWVTVKFNFCGFEKKHLMGLPLISSYRTQMWIMSTACLSALRCLINTGITSHVSEMWPPLKRSWQHWVTGREEHSSHWNWDKGCLESTEVPKSPGMVTWWVLILTSTCGQNKKIKIKVIFVQLLLVAYSVSELNFRI